ncbi:hypothetical protein [Snodgrassella gandavensis]|uniref:hypothetical protein n=1 Tax=Snodgrassella gandavensis TaxID=2946698 RepID=UPI001EF5897B|nr:hypothetical protein [Snodgrassella gandavensis]
MYTDKNMHFTIDCYYVEIDDVNIGGAPNPPAADDQDNGKDKPRNLQKVKNSYLKKKGMIHMNLRQTM